MPNTLDFPQDVPPDQQTYSQTDRRKDDRTSEATAGCVVIVRQPQGGRHQDDLDSKSRRDVR